MERRPKTKSKEGSGSSSSTEDNRTSSSDHASIVEQIRSIAAHNARAPLDTEKQLLLFLQSWWSRTYNRPLKDPILQTYSLEELLYEFYDRVERNTAEEERLEHEDDKIEEDKERATIDWAEQEERKELEALKAQASKQEEQPALDPLKDPDNIKWMQDQIELAKAVHGESFGEDIKDDFEE